MMRSNSLGEMAGQVPLCTLSFATLCVGIQVCALCACGLASVLGSGELLCPEFDSPPCLGRRGLGTDCCLCLYGTTIDTTTTAAAANNNVSLQVTAIP